MKPTSRNNDHLRSDDGRTQSNSTYRLSPSLGWAEGKLKTSFLSRKPAITIFLSRSSIAFEDLLASSIASQVMPPWCVVLNLSVSELGQVRQREEQQ